MPIGRIDELPEIKFPTGEITTDDLDQLRRIAHLASSLPTGDLFPDNIRPIVTATPPETMSLKTHGAAAPILMSNLGQSILNLGLTVEETYNERLLQDAHDAREIQKTIEQLIDLSTQFAVHADGDGEKAVSDKIQEMCNALKQSGIEILQSGEKKISKERMAEIKANISSHTERLKTDLQIKFTTEIQVKINELHSILECMKTIEKYMSRLHSTIVSNQKTK